MNPKPPNPALRSLYRFGLYLYPAHLRRGYEEQILVTFDDAWRDHRTTPLRFWVSNFADLFYSAVKEQLLMAQDIALNRPIFAHALIIGIMVTFIGLAAAVTVQQMLRRGANQPQYQLADVYAKQLAAGSDPEQVLPAGHIDLADSLAPFVIVYDDQIRPLASNGYLQESIPTPPRGVFDYARRHTINVLTWQPRPGVRIAAVVRRVNGPNPGFVLTGRSLTVVERQESLLWYMSFGVWFLILALLAGGAFFLGRTQRQQLA
jgi:hypothetical protein